METETATEMETEMAATATGGSRIRPFPRMRPFPRPAGRSAALGIASLWLLAAGPDPASAASPDRAITVASWGGPYEHSQVKAYFEPFTKATGIRIDVERYDGGLEELRRQVNGGGLTWDLMDMTMADNRAACRQGLLEPIDHSLLHPAPDGTPAAGDFVDGALTECGVAQIVYAMVAAYHRDAFPGSARPGSGTSSISTGSRGRARCSEARKRTSSGRSGPTESRARTSTSSSARSAAFGSRSSGSTGSGTT